MIPGKPFEAGDILNIFRRWPAIVVPSVLVAAIGAAVIHRLPNQYRSETLILVVPQRVPEEYVRSTVTTRIEDRLRSINQQITSRTRLEPIIKEFNLYPDQVRTGLMEDVIARMRLDIKTDIMRSDAFRISYMSDDARTAMRVTERLASLYIDESLRDREVLADSTNQFLDSQLAAAKERLVEHEKKLEAYKLRFTGQLPGQVQTNLQVMQNAQLQIQSIVDSLNRDRDRRLVLQGQLADLGVSIDGSEPTKDEEPKRPVVPPAAAELAAARKSLDEMRLRLRDSHPDVLRQQRVISDLEKKAAAEAAALAADGARSAVPDLAETQKQTRIEQIRSELESLNRQVTQKEDEEARLRLVVKDYQRRVEAAPVRESELTELMRDYDTLQRGYTTLLSKKEEAQVSANLERHQIGEQFKILDPARLPEKPFSPNRPLLYGITAGSGVLFGLLLAGFLEYRDTSLKTDADVVVTLTLPVLAMIPELESADTRKAAFRRRLNIWGLMAGTAAVAIGAIVWSFRS